MKDPCNAPLRGAVRRNVLVSSASRKAPLLRAMQDAARRIDPEACVIAGDLDPKALTQHIADGFWAMPRTEEGELGVLIEGCRARGIGAVLPTRDGELLFWARHRQVFAEAGIIVLVSPPDVVALCLDKLAFARFGAEAGLPVIPASQRLDAVGRGPFAVKERFGAGSRGIGLNLDAQAARAHAEQLKAPIFQPFVEGQEISIDGWLDADSRVVGVVLRRRDKVVSGESQVTTTFRQPALEALAAKVLARLGLCGPVVMQAVLTDDGMQIIEVNARFGGASTIAIAAGLDTLHWSLEEAFGTAVQPVFCPRPHTLRQVRLPNDIVFHDPDI